MSRGKKTDSKKIAEVIKVKTENVDLSSRDIEKKTGVSNSVVSTIIKEELGQVRSKSEVIAEIIDNDREFIELASTMGTNKLRKLIQNSVQWRDLDLSELDKIVSMAEKIFKRFTLLQGDMTNPEWGMKKLTKEEEDMINNTLKENELI